MRVLHVVTLCSPRGEFGGPQQAALNETGELARRGRRVLLATGVRGYQTVPRLIDGVPVLAAPVHQVVPRAGFSGLASPGLFSRIGPVVRGATVVHVHLSRDLVTLPFALCTLAAGKPLVVQCHGMVDPPVRLLAGPLDALATRRVLRRASAVLYLNDRERDGLEAVARTPLVRATRLLNGVPPVPGPPVARDDRLVVFAARLHPRKRPELFVEAAARVLRSTPDVRFVLIGPDEGMAPATLARIRALGVGHAVSWLGPQPHAEVLRWLGRAAVHVLPSAVEPYGMTIVEAMSVGTPVVVMDCCGLADDVVRTGAGSVTASDPDAIAWAVEHLLADPGARAVAGECGLRAVRERFGLATVVDRLEAIYAEVTGSAESTGVVGSAEDSADAEEAELVEEAERAGRWVRSDR